MRTCERPYATVLVRIGCGGLPDREVKPCGKPAKVRRDTPWHKGPAVLCDDCHRELSTPLGEHVPRSAWENRHHRA